MVRHMFTLRGLNGFDHFFNRLEKAISFRFYLFHVSKKDILYLYVSMIYFLLNEQKSIYYTNSVCSRSKVNNIVMHVHLQIFENIDLSGKSKAMSIFCFKSLTRKFTKKVHRLLEFFTREMAAILIICDNIQSYSPLFKF